MYLVAAGMLALRTEERRALRQSGVELVFEMIDYMVPETNYSTV